MDGKIVHAEQWDKSRALTKVIDSIPDIHSFDQKCVIIKGLLQSEKLKQRMFTIGVDQSLSNCAMY